MRVGRNGHDIGQHGPDGDEDPAPRGSDRIPNRPLPRRVAQGHLDPRLRAGAAHGTFSAFADDTEPTSGPAPAPVRAADFRAGTRRGREAR